MELERRIKECESLMDLLDDLDQRGIHGYLREKAVSRYVTLKARYNDIPVSGSFELTPLCNFDCKMCYVHLRKEQMNNGERLLSVDEWKVIIKHAIDAGMMYASLTGGECLTYPGFKEIYSFLVSNGIQPSVLTNGWLLTEDLIQFFSMYPPEAIQVTIYGSNDDAYQAVTGHRAFNRVINNIKRVKEAGINLFLTVSPSIFMKDDVKPLLELVHAMDVPYTIGNTTLQAREETQRDMADYAADLDTLKEIRRCEQAIDKPINNAAQLRQFVEYIPPRKQPHKGLPCGGAHSSFHVNWRGEVCPCIGYAEAVHSSATDKGFLNAFMQIREMMQTYVPPAECVSCELKEQCAVCPAEKTKSVLGGPLNTFVCQRVRQSLLERG